MIPNHFLHVCRPGRCVTRMSRSAATLRRIRSWVVIRTTISTWSPCTAGCSSPSTSESAQCIGLVVRRACSMIVESVGGRLGHLFDASGCRVCRVLLSGFLWLGCSVLDYEAPGQILSWNLQIQAVDFGLPVGNSSYAPPSSVNIFTIPIQ